jgi:peptide/nickel transport system permease protein
VRYLARRLLQSLFLLLGVSVLSFIFVELAPGSFLDEIRLNPQISGDTIAGLRKQYGMDRPLPVRYSRWLNSVSKGELGFSFAYNAPVGPLIWARGRNTLLLTVPALVLGWLIALPLGVLSAARRRGWIDGGCTLVTLVLLMTPDLLLALGFLWLAIRTHWFPVGGMLSLGAGDETPWAEFQNLAAHSFLPVAVLTLGSLPVLWRHTRSTMLEVLDSPYIRAAGAHGISQMRILLRHALPAALNPLISLFGLSLGSLLSASLVIEVVMSWPGVGPLLLEAILARDLYVVIGAVMFSTLFLVCGIFLGDILLFICDPRIRAEGLA